MTKIKQTPPDDQPDRAEVSPSTEGTKRGEASKKEKLDLTPI